MPDTELITIGAFARACGLSASALRFYADASILVPAVVDAATGYRYYAPEQTETARLIRHLVVTASGIEFTPPSISARRNPQIKISRQGRAGAPGRCSRHCLLIDCPAAGCGLESCGRDWPSSIVLLGGRRGNRWKSGAVAPL
ncbi:MerR family DNA-binding transcriptional regulator [Nocardia sp. IBHARD005]|uniref:MerR family DNA-binding transcriptional regulator n=1 Tax=Nocardia sp. IBHARD005 TaxID=3457765 RepID=UPI0040588603